MSRTPRVGLGKLGCGRDSKRSSGVGAGYEYAGYKLERMGWRKMMEMETRGLELVAWRIKGWMDPCLGRATGLARVWHWDWAGSGPRFVRVPLSGFRPPRLSKNGPFPTVLPHDESPRREAEANQRFLPTRDQRMWCCDNHTWVAAWRDGLDFACLRMGRCGDGNLPSRLGAGVWATHGGSPTWWSHVILGSRDQGISSCQAEGHS